MHLCELWRGAVVIEGRGCETGEDGAPGKAPRQHALRVGGVCAHVCVRGGVWEGIRTVGHTMSHTSEARRATDYCIICKGERGLASLA